MSSSLNSINRRRSININCSGENVVKVLTFGKIEGCENERSFQGIFVSATSWRTICARKIDLLLPNKVIKSCIRDLFIFAICSLFRWFRWRAKSKRFKHNGDSAVENWYWLIREAIWSHLAPLAPAWKKICSNAPIVSLKIQFIVIKVWYANELVNDDDDTHHANNKMQHPA